MTENEISGIVVDACIQIHRGLGPGLLESAYEEVLDWELRERGLHVMRQKEIPLLWKDVRMNKAFIADLIVNQKVILELKSVENMHPVFYKQLLTYLKLTNLRLGLLINFNEPLMKTGIHRVVNNL